MLSIWADSMTGGRPEGRSNNHMTLKKFDVYATLPASDIERARAFYREILGLKELKSDSEMPGALFQAGNNTRVYLYQRGPTKADHTVLSFQVSDIERVVGALRDRGVRFEHYGRDGEASEQDITTFGTERGAWFKDSEGNILSIYEKVASPPEESNGKEVRT